MEEASLHPLPNPSLLSPPLQRFLADNFKTKQDLFNAPDLASHLHKHCSDLGQRLADLASNLATAIAAYDSHSDLVRGFFKEITAKLTDLRSSTSVSAAFLDEREGEGLGKPEHVFAEELPALAKEVARVETVRAYAETALWLDTLIGDVEDAVSSSLTGNLRKTTSGTSAEEMRLLAIKSLKQTEDVLTSITKSRPQWTCLVAAVDHRVDRALAILRPQAIADHRALLSSLGWPPPLSTSGAISSSPGKSSELLNPLFIMQGDVKNQYCENFLALCNLQELQRGRKSRQLEGYNRDVALRQPLWAIEELVNPISLASQQHFAKWVEKPEFIFALAYKITRDFVEAMDEVLQPLVDKARLAGYSCREEWISAMVTALSTYLAKELFPIYVKQLEEDSGVESQARTLWLNIVDLMISFDKRIQSLISNSGVLISVREDENLQRISSLSVFCDRPDWLEIWAEIELTDALDKLKKEMDDGKGWNTKIKNSLALLSGSENYKSPAVAGTVLWRLSMVIDRCRPLPSIQLRARFIRLVAAPVVREFLDFLLRRCQEAEGLTALADDDALLKVTNSVNAVCYCESVLKEWCEDVFFLELASEVATNSGAATVENFGKGPDARCIFEDELVSFKEFRTEWVEKISTVILRGFDARCRDYIRNKKQWQEKGESGFPSQAFVGALDYLQGKIVMLEAALNEVDFVGVWRSLAAAVDQLVFNGILMSNSKFSDGGVARFAEDLEVLFGVFSAWCLRPKGFFPKICDGLTLLKMERQQRKDGLEKGKERWLREEGIRHLSMGEAEKIAKNRISVR
ncbi:hypothetical protein ACLOJK_029020 [Asimina triloba]